TYNSNPAAMQAMLPLLAATDARRRVVVSGDMLELGPGGPAAHQALAGQIAAAGVSLFIGVGPLSALTVASLKSRPGLEALDFPDAAAAARNLPERIRKGDLILVKGSRGMSTEIIVAALKEALKKDGP
ncbi:MAG: glutamate ligase domain-containing protein, partial [Acidobacteriota bacterium]